jgi:hypothetical protein
MSFFVNCLSKARNLFNQTNLFTSNNCNLLLEFGAKAAVR